MTHTHVRIPIINCSFTLSEEVKHTLVFTLLRTFYLSVAGVFVPVFIYSSFGFQIMIFYLFMYYGLFYPLSVPLVKFLIRTKSVEYAQMLSIFTAILQIIFLNLIKDPWFLVVPAVFGGFTMSFYWIPKHLVFGIFGNRRQVTEQYAFVSSLSFIISILGPVITSIFIYFFGYGVVFWSVSLILAVFSLFVFNSLRRKRRVYHGRKIRKKIKKFYPLFVLEGFGNALYLMAMLLVYFFTKDVVVYGGLTSMATLFAVLTTLLISRWVDRKHDYAFGALGILLRAHLFTILYLSLNPETVAFTMVALGLITAFVDTPCYGFLYNIVKKYGEDVVYKRAYLLSVSGGLFFLAFLFVDLRIMLSLGAFITILLGFVYYLLSMSEEISEIKRK